LTSNEIRTLMEKSAMISISPGIEGKQSHEEVNALLETWLRGTETAQTPALSSE
jgi:hypothetical protein